MKNRAIIFLKFTKYRMHFLLFMAIIFVISCDEILDIFPPDIELLSPTEEILTADTVTFLVDATDNKGIDRVAFTLRDPVDGKEVKKTINSAPFQLELFDVQTWSQIELEVKAYDEVGNFGLFEKILLIQSTVENASIAITEPNGNETWVTGDTETIRWASIDVPGNVVIDLYKGNSFLERIVTDTKNDGAYNWDIPDYLASGTNYKVRIYWISNSAIDDFSDNYFTLESPPAEVCFINLSVTSPDDCIENTNYFYFTWAGGCIATDLWWGTTSGNITNHVELAGTGSAELSLYGFGPGKTYYLQLGSNGTLSNVISGTTSNTDCSGGGTLGADCGEPYYCSNCGGCESNCCPNYCSGNYYYYNRSCSNGFCVGATSDYCPNGCDDNGCL